MADRPFDLSNFQQFDPSQSNADFELVVAGRGLDLRTRPFKILRTKFRKRMDQSGARIVGITSATPGAGKSFLAANLAASLAQVSEDPVYVVDLDLRRGSLSSRMGLEEAPGISEVLQGTVPSLREVGWRITDTNLVIFPAGAEARRSAELVSTSDFTAQINDLRQSTGASTVIVDLPPAFASDDAMLIAKELDCYLLVVESGVTSKRQVREVLAMMAPTPLLGTVMNRYRGGISDTFSYGYGSKAYADYYD